MPTASPQTPNGTPEPHAGQGDLRRLAERYSATRRATERLCAPLSVEDCQVQSMDDSSPAKWHLAHTSWFFETFVLAAARSDYRAYHPDFRVLFNSYYQSVGEQHPRPHRGLLSRPSLDEVLAYRRHVDTHVLALLDGAAHANSRAVIELGLQHEQQHQELILTDIKHLLFANPLRPAYRELRPLPAAPALPLSWSHHAGGVEMIGAGPDGFAFDNERPRHRVVIEPFELASRLVTNAELCAFIDDGGYSRPELWLSDGWSTVLAEGWSAPLYWERHEGEWRIFTLGGPRSLCASEPASHVSYYEADAFARWVGARLPTEAEWEIAAAAHGVEGNFVESGALHPAAARLEHDPAQLFGDLWEWTASAYQPYPGYRAPAGALGEYNGKFMCRQMVLRGGSCATPQSHMRASYRNFFPPSARWQFTGIRLARDGT